MSTNLVRLVEVVSNLRLQVIHHEVESAVCCCPSGSLAVIRHVRVPVVAVQRPVYVGGALEHGLQEVYLFRERGVRVDLQRGDPRSCRV